MEPVTVTDEHGDKEKDVAGATAKHRIEQNFPCRIGDRRTNDRLEEPRITVIGRNSNTRELVALLNLGCHRHLHKKGVEQRRRPWCRRDDGKQQVRCSDSQMASKQFRNLVAAGEWLRKLKITEEHRSD
ncbi:syntaxin-132-like [Dorcoceras hygrometricum]|uniref:Syntaxin-132-like n=1 Tax=Dorcoceras hygrometricum TaxID=472368 RepID=A0A2Z7DJQ0_9LAMI|nr:syntaxin-132-like [Dorcoceras hygrometricum]